MKLLEKRKIGQLQTRWELKKLEKIYKKLYNYHYSKCMSDYPAHLAATATVKKIIEHNTEGL